MRIASLVCFVLLVSFAWGQGNPAASGAPQKPAARGVDDDEKEPMPASASAVAPDSAVLTVKGLCPGKSSETGASSADPTCRVVITRAQFELLSAAIHANAPIQKRQLATSYPRIMAMAHEAERLGLDKQAHFQQMIAFSRLQLLSQELLHKFQDEASQVPENEIQDYYRDHSSAFERATLERITVPDIRQVEAANPATASGEERPAQTEKDKAAMKQEAETLRAAAMKGEDFAKLQKQAYDFARLNTPAPPTSLLKARRASLPPQQQSAFDLKPGEVSPVISDAGGYFIYKLVASETEPLEEARAEIHKKLEEQRMRALMQKVQDSVTTDVNQAYFGSAAGPGHSSGQRANPKPPREVQK